MKILNVPVCSGDNASELVQGCSVGGSGGEADFTGVVDSGVSNAPSESELLHKRQRDRRESEYIELRVDLIISLKYKHQVCFVSIQRSCISNPPLIQQTSNIHLRGNISQLTLTLQDQIHSDTPTVY